MEKIINSLLASPISEAFREPVDWRGLGLEDYPVVIKKPMDLGTIKRLLEKGYYSNLDEVAADVRLIWRNCRTYNCGGVPRKLHKAADTLDKRFEAHFAKLKKAENVGIECKKTVKGKAAAELPPALNDDDRSELVHLLGRIRCEQRTAAVHEIDRLCPEALTLNGDAIDIDVDRLDAKTFIAVERIVAPQAASQRACNKRSAARCNGGTSASDAASVVGRRRGDGGKDPLRARKKRPAARCSRSTSASGVTSVGGEGRGVGGEDPLQVRNKRPAALCSRSTSTSDDTSVGGEGRGGGGEDPLRARNKRPAGLCSRTTSSSDATSVGSGGHGDGGEDPLRACNKQSAARYNGGNHASDYTFLASDGAEEGRDEIDEKAEGAKRPCKKAKV